MTSLALTEIQGLVLTAYTQAAVAQYSFLRIIDSAACLAQLRAFLPQITFFPQREDACCTNIAFTASGLQKLGLIDCELATFSRAFTEGMTSPDRLRLLGDDADQVKKWYWGSGEHAVDLAIFTFHVDHNGLQAALQQVHDIWIGTGACELIATVSSMPRPTHSGAPDEEHFGFADGISQPIIRELAEGKPSRADALRQSNGIYYQHNLVSAGEFLFGYPNEYARTLAPPLATPRSGSLLKPVEKTMLLNFGANGSYMVVRQMEQDVAAFWNAIDQATQVNGQSDPAARTRLASQMVGRWPNGAPLARFPHEPPATMTDSNSFLYLQHDPHGLHCPLGAHIRRTNPRDALGTDTTNAARLANRHRILRRGRPYGPWIEDPMRGDGQTRGLMFVCFNANIERQFEFIQNTWANNQKFAGLYTESDPIFGALDHPDQGGLFTVQAQPARRHYQGLRRFVTVVGGGYFFLPSRAALQHLTL
jgi:Dyp-type peroxidase family